MLYIPKNIPKEVNVSENRFFRSFILPVGIFFGILFVLIYLLIPILIQKIPPETEIQWRNNYKIFRIESDSFSKDTPKELIQLVNQLWHPYTSAPHLKLNLNIIKAKAENAYMGFGGQMALTEELIRRSQSENELTMIICHELGHLYHRHIVNRLAQMIIWSIADFFLSSFSYYSVNSSINFLTSQKFNRDQENQADSFGLDCLHNKYGHINGAETFFQRLSTKKEMSTINQLPEFIMTHPHSENRIQYLHDYALEKGYPLDGTLSINTFVDKSK